MQSSSQPLIHSSNDNNNTSTDTTTEQNSTTLQGNTSTLQQDENIPRLEFKNFKKLALSNINNGGRIDWIFDETNCYRVSIHKDDDGNLHTQPINGALFTFNMNSGQLFLKVIHTSKWTGLTKLGQHSKIAAAEELAALIRALPDALHPQIVFTTRAAIIPFIKNVTSDFQTEFTACTFFLPLQALMQIPRFKEVVQNATEPKLVFFLMYDDWLMEISPAAAFHRLIIILQALRRKCDTTLHIINPRGEQIAPDRVWAKLSTDEWNQIEGRLRDLIIEDFMVKNNIQGTHLTEEQIEMVIYGEDFSLEALFLSNSTVQ